MADLRAGDQAIGSLWVGDQAVARMMAGETEVWAPPVSAVRAVWEFNASSMGWMKDEALTRPVDWIAEGGNPTGHISVLVNSGLFATGSMLVGCYGWQWDAAPGTVCTIEADTKFDNRGASGGVIPIYANLDTEESIVGLGGLLYPKDGAWRSLRADEDDVTFPLPASGGNYAFGFLTLPAFSGSSGRWYLDNVRVVDVATREPVLVVPAAGAVVSQ